MLHVFEISSEKRHAGKKKSTGDVFSPNHQKLVGTTLSVYCHRLIACMTKSTILLSLHLSPNEKRDGKIGLSQKIQNVYPVPFHMLKTC